MSECPKCERREQLDKLLESCEGLSAERLQMVSVMAFSLSERRPPKTRKTRADKGKPRKQNAEPLLEEQP
jgi:hypothetical protein